jgi:hypothetical protein
MKPSKFADNRIDTFFAILLIVVVALSICLTIVSHSIDQRRISKCEKSGGSWVGDKCLGVK